MLENEDSDRVKNLFDENLPEEELTKRQMQILDAAIKVFSEKGFEGSRTSDIAREAEVAEGTIFRYYKTKKDLLLGLLIPMVTKFFRPLIFKSIEPILNNKEKKPIKDLMKELLLDRLKLARKNAPLVKTVMMESVYHPELLGPIQKNIAPEIIKVLDNFIKQNIENGNFRDLQPRLISRTTMSFILGYIVLTSTLPETFPIENDEAEIRKIVDILLHGIESNKE